MSFARILGLVMAYFSMSFADIKRLPAPAFWAMVEQIPALKAEDDLRFINAVSAATWGNEEYIKSLMSKIGQNTDDNSNEFDTEAFEKFRRSLNK